MKFKEGDKVYICKDNHIFYSEIYGDVAIGIDRDQSFYSATAYVDSMDVAEDLVFWDVPEDRIFNTLTEAVEYYNEPKDRKSVV